MLSAQAKEFAVVRPSKVAGQTLGLSIDRSAWTDTSEAVTVTLHASLDRGETWIDWCGYTDRGGEEVYPNGTPMTASALVVTPPPDGALLKVSVVSNGKLVLRPVSFVELT